MYEYIMEKMVQDGYRHYEISNFARPGFESRHNMTYWKNESYYGLGAGAHGYVNGVRHVNMKGVRNIFMRRKKVCRDWKNTSYPAKRRWKIS